MKVKMKQEFECVLPRSLGLIIRILLKRPIKFELPEHDAEINYSPKQ